MEKVAVRISRIEHHKKEETPREDRVLQKPKWNNVPKTFIVRREDSFWRGGIEQKGQCGEHCSATLVPTEMGGTKTVGAELQPESQPRD